MIRSPRQGIRPTHLPTQLVGQDEVKPGEVQGPSCLAVVQLMSLSEIGQVFMICVDLKLLIGSFEEVPPLLQCAHNCQHLFVMDLVVPLCVGEADRKSTRLNS